MISLTTKSKLRPYFYVFKGVESFIFNKISDGPGFLVINLTKFLIYRSVISHTKMLDKTRLVTFAASQGYDKDLAVSIILEYQYLIHTIFHTYRSVISHSKMLDKTRLVTFVSNSD